MKSLGLALGGGGLRGLAHIGILQVLEDHNIDISYISGTSIGSIIAGLHACGLSAYEIESIVLKLSPEDYLDYNISGVIKYLIALLIPGVSANLNGFIKGDKLEKLIYRLTRGKSLQEGKIPVAIISCDINSGKEVIFCNNSIDSRSDEIIIKDALFSEAARCSSAIPATFVPRCFQGMQMVDGGIRTMVPVYVQKQMGTEYILAVNLGQKEYKRKAQGIPDIISRSINILTFETSDTEEELFADMLIYPAVGDVGIDDLDQAEAVIAKGRSVMLERINKLKQELNE